MAAILVTTVTYAGARPPSPQLTSSNSTEVFRWGSYDPAPTNKQVVPRSVAGLTGIVQVHASNDSSYALQCVGGVTACPTDGIVWAWGYNGNGQLGNGTTAKSPDTAQQVQFPPGVYITAIGEARNRGMAIDATGQAWFWGQDTGDTCIDRKGNQETPVKVPHLTSAVDVEGGSGNVIWLLANGTVEQCRGATIQTEHPVAVPGLSNIVQITSGNQFFGARDNAGNVFMWGYDRFGQVGTGRTGYVVFPTKVNLPAPAADLSAGGDHPTDGHTLALLTNGQLYAWGQGHQFQLGNGSRSGSLVPIAIAPPAGVTFTLVAAGGDQSFAVDSQGRLWHWGNGSRRMKVVDSRVDQISAVAGDVVDHHVG